MSAALDIKIFGTGRELGRALGTDLAAAHTAGVAVAFAKRSGLDAVDLNAWCRDGGQLRLVAGTDFALTDLGLIRDLESNPTAKCKVFHSLRRGVFHPKLYVLDGPRSRVAYVSSANFTHGGLEANYEAGVRLEGAMDDPHLVGAVTRFETYYESEFATPLSQEFAARYEELQARRSEALAHPDIPEATRRSRAASALLLARHRGRGAARKHILVVDPRNYAICMRTRLWGKRHEGEIKAYAPGDLFFFHVGGGRGIAALGMFTGLPFYDASELWPPKRGSTFPWRIRFEVLGELHSGIPTRKVLERLRPGAPSRWFNGWIQSSHSLTGPDFEALRVAFEADYRADLGLSPAV